MQGILFAFMLKNISMKAIACILLVVILCSYTFHKLQQTPSPEGKWQLIPVTESDTVTGKIPTLTFHTDTKRVTGNTGCNNYSGTFNIEKSNLSFNNDYLITRMACPAYNEAAFIKNMLRTNNFSIS